MYDWLDRCDVWNGFIPRQTAVILITDSIETFTPPRVWRTIIIKRRGAARRLTLRLLRTKNTPKSICLPRSAVIFSRLCQLPAPASCSVIGEKPCDVYVSFTERERALGKRAAGILYINYFLVFSFFFFRWFIYVQKGFFDRVMQTRSRFPMGFLCLAISMIFGDFRIDPSEEGGAVQEIFVWRTAPHVMVAASTFTQKLRKKLSVCGGFSTSQHRNYKFKLVIIMSCRRKTGSAVKVHFKIKFNACRI